MALPRDFTADALAKLRLTACDLASSDYHYARVAADGTFRIAGLKGKRYVVSAFECPDGFGLSPAFDIEAGAADVELRLVTALTLEGRVVDADGKPTRARVWARHARPTSFMSKIHETDAEGRFRLFVAPDFIGQIQAQHVDTPFVGQVDQVAAGARDLVLRLKRPR